MMRLSLLLVLSACAVPPPLHWSYGEAWEGVCKTGKQQSPVDLHAGGSAFAPRIQMEYWPTQTRLTNNGHTLQFDYDPGSFLQVDGKRYALVQFHFHHPGEHALDGAAWPMELHLVHKSDDGKLAVVAIQIAEGAVNRWLETAWNDLPAAPGEQRESPVKINAADLMPKDRAYLHYSGSLTAPPCSEGVEWFVLRAPASMSAEQIAAFDKLFHDNHRPVQPLGGRPVAEGQVR
jgi:carbonic anhydrase